MSPLLSDADRTEDGTSSRERRLRYRVLFAEYRTVLLLAFVVLFAVGGWVSYGAYADPGERTDRRLESEWTATGSVSHSAGVTEPNEIHPEGTRLEDEPLYYESISPTVDVEFDGGYDAARADNVTVELAVDLVYRAVDPEDGTVYWSRRERRASVVESAVGPNETVTAAASVNVTDVRTSIDAIESDLGASPGETEIVLELERRIDGTIAGEQRATNDSYEVAIEGEGATYRLAGPDSYDETHEEYATETVATSPGPIRSLGGPAFLLVGLAGLGGVGVATLRWSEPTPDEREWLAYRDDRAEFDEVITDASLPEEALEGPRAEVESLATLARLGIDLETAVVFDPDRRRYVVRDDDLTYVFEPPRLSPADDALAPVGGSDGATATTEVTTDALVTTDRADDDREDPSAASSEPTRESTDADTVTGSAGGDSASDSTPDADIDGEPPTGDASVGADPTPKPDAEPTAEPPLEARSDPLSEPDPAAASTPDLDAATDVGDDDLLSLAGLEPADISDPELFDLDADSDGAAANGSASPVDEDGSGTEIETGGGADDDSDGPASRPDAGS